MPQLKAKYHGANLYPLTLGVQFQSPSLSISAGLLWTCPPMALGTFCCRLQYAIGLVVGLHGEASAHCIYVPFSRGRSRFPALASALFVQGFQGTLKRTFWLPGGHKHQGICHGASHLLCSYLPEELLCCLLPRRCPMCAEHCE